MNGKYVKPNTLLVRNWREKNKHPCIDCGKPIYPNAIRCKGCSGKARTIITLCPDCGKRIRNNAKRCHSCDLKRRWKLYPETFNQPTGENSYNWKGGRIKDADGYIRIYKKDHPRASQTGYVSEHILVWEETHGKPLPKGWIVHHLNGIKDDNHPNNLIGLSNKKHYLVLQAKAKRIQELEALLNGQHQLL